MMGDTEEGGGGLQIWLRAPSNRSSSDAVAVCILKKKSHSKKKGSSLVTLVSKVYKGADFSEFLPIFLLIEQ
jgi:hypothetical protein